MYITATGNYKLDEFGIVHILVKHNASHIVARWKGARLHVTVPPAIKLDDLMSALRNMHARIDAKKPEAMYHIGQKITTPELSIDIVSQKHAPDKMLVNFNYPNATISVGTNWDMDSHNTMSTISKFLCRIAQRVAPPILIQQARDVSDEIGKSPLKWEISNGHRTLGHCSNKGVIALSYALIFYPLHLRRYVICHELAHLSEMNHSARFHLICDQYCQGKEKELVAQLKEYKIPIIK